MDTQKALQFHVLIEECPVLGPNGMLIILLC